MTIQTLVGFGIAFLIGFACGKSGIPLPAPNSITGVVLILSITIGYLVAKN